MVCKTPVSKTPASTGVSFFAFMAGFLLPGAASPPSRSLLLW